MYYEGLSVLIRSIFIANIFYVKAYMIDSFLYKAYKIEQTTRKSSTKVFLNIFAVLAEARKCKLS